MSDERLTMSKKQRLVALETESFGTRADIKELFKDCDRTANQVTGMAAEIDKLRKQVGVAQRDIAGLFQITRKLEAKPMLNNDIRAVMASLASMQTMIDDLKRQVADLTPKPLQLELYAK